MIISGKKIRLRAIEKDDLDVLKQAINSSELEYMENGFCFPVSDYEQSLWFEKLRNTKENQRLIIEYSNQAIGWLSLVDIDWKNRCAHTGIKIFNSEYRGKGLAQDAVMAIMRFSFDELNLNRLEGFMLDYNIASQKLYIDKCGWKVEGIKRKSVYKGGVYRDCIFVGILKNEYQEMLQKSGYWENND